MLEYSKILGSNVQIRTQSRHSKNLWVLNLLPKTYDKFTLMPVNKSGQPECLMIFVARHITFCSLMRSCVYSATIRHFEKVDSLLFARGRQQSGL